MTSHSIAAPLLLALALAAAPARAADSGWTVHPAWVAAHEAFLASDALQGRGSATRDEAIAAAYVAAEFEGYGLKPAPGMDGYLQRAEVVQLTLDAPAALSVGGGSVPVTLLIGSGAPVSGKLVTAGADLATLAPGLGVLLLDAPADKALQLLRAPNAPKLILLRESASTHDLLDRLGGKPRLPIFFKGQPPAERPSLAVLAPADFDRLAAQAGSDATLTLPGLREETRVTTNAIGYLPGTDPRAGAILYSAHLDHLGVRPDGVTMHGANDDASGTTAVLELAHAMAAGKPTRRSILFVAYGSEEIGGFGSRWFGAHSPVPLTQIVANIEFEMIGAQDPKLPAGKMMMTGFDRSNLGEALAAHGALLTGDPYPEQNFFQRSDNYSLALKGVVAHTISGWAVVPTYHQPTDTLANLDIGFMTRAIQSLVEPARWLADSDFKPDWKPGGKPSE